jgi:hypothetical protein
MLKVNSGGDLACKGLTGAVRTHERQPLPQGYR